MIYIDPTLVTQSMVSNSCTELKLEIIDSSDNSVIEKSGTPFTYNSDQNPNYLQIYTTDQSYSGLHNLRLSAYNVSVSNV